MPEKEQIDAFLLFSPFTPHCPYLVDTMYPWHAFWAVFTSKIAFLLSNTWLLLCLFIIWLVPQAGKMTQIVRCDWLPERARLSHLARSGLPAVSRKKNFPESHIINPLLTKFVRSRWLDIYFVLFFCEFMDLDFVLVHKHTQKKNLANILPS